MISGSGNGGKRVVYRPGDFRVRFRKTDSITHGSPLGRRFVQQRIKNGIIRNPIVRAEDPAGQKALIETRRCVIQAHELPAFLIEQDTIAVPAGRYEETCDYYYIGKDKGVDRIRELKGDRHLFPLRIGFLKRLGFTDCAQEIFLRSEESPDSNIRRQDGEMVGYMSMLDALNVVDLINLNLKGNYRVRVASELLVSAFLHNGGYEHCGRKGVYLTANYFYYGSGEESTYLEPLGERAIDGRIINNRKGILLNSGDGKKGYHAFIYRYVSTAGKLKIQRWVQGADSWMNCSVLFEVYEV